MVTSEQGDLLSACPPPPNPDLHPHQNFWYTTATNLGSDHPVDHREHRPVETEWVWEAFPIFFVMWVQESCCPELFFFFLFNMSPFQLVQLHSHSGCICESSQIILKMIESRWGGVPREDRLGQCHLPQRSRPSLTACKPSDGYPPGPIIPSKWSSLPILEHKAGFRSFLVYIGDLPGAACCFITRASAAPRFFFTWVLGNEVLIDWSPFYRIQVWSCQ